MGRLILVVLASLALAFGTACTTSSTVDPNPTESGCGYHNGKKLYLGPQGGCYYINSNGNKVYVDRSECKC